MNGLPAFVKMVRREMARRGARHELDDLEQDAAVAVLEARERYEKKTGVDLPIAGNRGYYFRAAVCDAGLEMARRVAAVSVTEWAVRGGAEGWKFGSGGYPWGRRVPIVGCGWEAADEVGAAQVAGEDVEDGAPVEVAGDVVADESLAEDEAANDRLMAIVGERIEELPRRDRRPLRLILGLGGGDPVEPAHAAKLARRTRAAVAASTKRLAAAVRADGAAIEARRVTSRQ